MNEDGRHGTGGSRAAPTDVRVNTAAILTGLAIAWGGTLLLTSPIAAGLADPSRPLIALAGQALFWALGGAVIAIVLFQSSRVTYGYRTGSHRHASATASPAAFNRISPSTIAPNMGARSSVHTVTKYAPSAA